MRSSTCSPQPSWLQRSHPHLAASAGWSEPPRNGRRRHNRHHSSAPILPPNAAKVGFWFLPIKPPFSCAASRPTGSFCCANLTFGRRALVPQRAAHHRHTVAPPPHHCDSIACSPRSPQRLVRHLWRAYCYALATSPLATQSATAVVGFAAGDACAQVCSSAVALKHTCALQLSCSGTCCICTALSSRIC